MAGVKLLFDLRVQFYVGVRCDGEWSTGQLDNWIFDEIDLKVDTDTEAQREGISS